MKQGTCFFAVNWSISNIVYGVSIATNCSWDISLLCDFAYTTNYQIPYLMPHTISLVVMRSVAAMSL